MDVTIRKAPHPRKNSHVSSDCVARTALLVFRGIGAGVAWSIAVDGYGVVSLPSSYWYSELQHQHRTVTNANVFREMLTAWSLQSMKNCVGFGAFLGIFGGVSCCMEKAFGRHELLNPFVGGCTAGLCLVPAGSRNLKRLAVTSLACGIASVGFQLLIPSGTEETPKR